MPFKTDWIRFGDQKQHIGFLAWPDRATPSMPGVIVIQEAWGVDEHIEDVTLRFARAGYVALAPDLFSENGERPVPLSHPRTAAVKALMSTHPTAWSDPTAREEALSKLPEPGRSEVRESFGALSGAVMSKFDVYVPQLVDAAAFLRDTHALTKGAKVGSVGFCLGGALSARLACADPKLSAAVIFYGMAPPADQIANIGCPVLGLYGGLDARVNGGIAEFSAAMQKHGKRFEHQVYEGAQHAFFNDTRPSYNPAAARDAFARTLELFRRELS
jgi:carboxymethylenebutenolidase